MGYFEKQKWEDNLQGSSYLIYTLKYLTYWVDKSDVLECQLEQTKETLRELG